MQNRSFPLLIVAALTVGVVGCDDPPADDFRREGGASPDPTGVIEGTVFYSGPRPQCVRDGSGTPVRPIGRVILTLFVYDNPPPPSGSATTAANLLTIPGEELFTDLSDCLPADEEPDYVNPEDRIMRSVSFIWPEITLPVSQSVSYQIRGFYDYDEDFNPFFSVTNLPTRGDVAGGAFVDVSAERPEFLRIEFPSQRDAPNGAINDTPTVTLGAVVNTERPMFQLQGNALSSEATLPVSNDASERESMLWQTSRTRISLFPRTPDAAVTNALDTAGIDLAFDDEVAYAWYPRPVDGNNDGDTDLHPILESAEIFWWTPITIMRREKSMAERFGGLPDVLLIGSVRPTQVELSAKRTFYRSMDMAIPPVAVVDLNPANPACRLPYIPPGNTTATYERIPVECHEVPSGAYSINVLQGLAGATSVQEDLPDLVSDTGFALEGGQFSSQAWSIPNELGSPVQLGSEDAVLPSQGLQGRFIVYDPNPGENVSRRDGIEACTMAPDPEDEGMVRSVTYMEVPDACCTDAVRALCDLPLCDYTTGVPGVYGDTDPGVEVMSQGTDANGDGKLDCVPFRMPLSCCDG